MILSLTLELTRTAPVSYSMERKRHRGIGCTVLLALFGNTNTTNDTNDNTDWSEDKVEEKYPATCGPRPMRNEPVDAIGKHSCNNRTNETTNDAIEHFHR
ncbi:MAG TPA: hypothetical protein VLT36_12695 [Candidatus Dormibacteraeota bacterium]|nr:hypothetical protein [Candidatus Dormibacteraeota bacterium]